MQIQQRVFQELLPVQQQFQGLRRDLLLQLDASSQTVRLGKVARATLSQTIAGLAQALLEEGVADSAGGEDPEWLVTLQAIYQRHAPAPEEPPDAALLRQMLADQWGLPGADGEAGAAGAEGAENDAPESFAAFMDRVLREHLAAERAAQDAAPASSRAKKRPRGPTARERQQAAQAEQQRQALRTLYRQLVRVIHPDRELDPVRRQHKTQLMQRANQAYASQDLLALLALQQERGQREAGTVDSAEEDLLKTYNRLLQEQVASLKQQIQNIQIQAAQCIGPSVFGLPTRRELLRSFEETLREMRAAVKGLQAELPMLRQPATLKTWLQERRREIRWQEQMARDTAWYGEEDPWEF